MYHYAVNNMLKYSKDINKIEDNRPKDYETILEWLHMVQRNYKGFYILGV